MWALCQKVKIHNCVHQFWSILKIIRKDKNVKWSLEESTLHKNSHSFGLDRLNESLLRWNRLAITFVFVFFCHSIESNQLCYSFDYSTLPLSILSVHMHYAPAGLDHEKIRTPLTLNELVLINSSSKFSFWFEDLSKDKDLSIHMMHEDNSHNNFFTFLLNDHQEEYSTDLELILLLIKRNMYM